jgi:hypothetical protein
LGRATAPGWAQPNRAPIVKFRILFSALAASAVLVGCLGNSGESVPPPSDVHATVGDGIVGITWTRQFGVNYMAFASTNSNVTTVNWTDAGIAGFAVLNDGNSTIPPALLCDVTNGLDYYFTIDAHTGTSPGGPGSRTVKATGRPAGGPGTWAPGTQIVGATINGVGYGSISGCLPYGFPTGIFVAVGLAGAIVTSSNGNTHGNSWTTRTPSGYTDNLYGVTAFTAPTSTPVTPALLFVAVGAGGAVIRSGDGVTWTVSVAGGSAPTLRSVFWSGTVFVAVGDGGRIQTSVDGVTWTVQTSNTSVNLHSVECVYTATALYTCVAVGDGGVIDISVDGGTTWSVKTVGGGASALRAVAYGNFDNNRAASGVIGVNGVTSINTWVVVGDSGTAFESTAVTTGVKASAWNAVPISGATNLVGISYSSQFVAIDAAGNAFASQTATAGTWSAAVSSGVVNPAGMATDSHGFVAVGSAGDNASSF